MAVRSRAAGSAHAVVAGLDPPPRPRLRNGSERNYPTVTDPSRLPLLRRGLLRAASRGATGTDPPLELNLLQRVFHYQRPETTGF